MKIVKAQKPSKDGMVDENYYLICFFSIFIIRKEKYYRISLFCDLRDKFPIVLIPTILIKQDYGGNTILSLWWFNFGIRFDL